VHFHYRRRTSISIMAIFQQPSIREQLMLTHLSGSDNNAGRMRIFELAMILAACTLPLAAEDVFTPGYVDCSSGDKHRLTSVFQNPCVTQPAGSLSCGEDVKVLGRDGPWLKIASTDGSERYISILAVSQRRDRFVALDLPVPSGPYIPDCSAFRPKTGKVHPRAIRCQSTFISTCFSSVPRQILWRRKHALTPGWG
jgi:hypothetical protein